MIAAGRRFLVALLSMTMAGAAAAAVIGQQHRPIDPAHTRAAPGALVTLGGPKTTSPAAGPRFPIVPAGALAAHPANAMAYHPAASAPARAAPIFHGPALHPAAVTRPPAGGIRRPSARPSAPSAPVAEAAPAPAP